jgi:hypothetical protein
LAYQLEEKNFLNKCSQINQSAGRLNISLSKKDVVVACPSKRILEPLSRQPVFPIAKMFPDNFKFWKNNVRTSRIRPTTCIVLMRQALDYFGLSFWM